MAESIHKTSHLLMQMSAFQLRCHYLWARQLMQFCGDPIITECCLLNQADVDQVLHCDAGEFEEVKYSFRTVLSVCVWVTLSGALPFQVAIIFNHFWERIWLTNSCVLARRRSKHCYEGIWARGNKKPVGAQLECQQCLDNHSNCWATERKNVSKKKKSASCVKKTT